MNLTSLGIGSGLPLESIVEAFINAEAVPNEIRLQEKEDSLNLELSGVGSFKSSLSTFQSILKKLTAEDAFNKQTVTTSDQDIDVTTNGFASNGSFSIEIQQLAQGSRRQSTVFSSSTDTVGLGILTFNAGTGTFDVAIDDTDDLSAIRDKINAQAENFGVTANIINSDLGSYLVYNSTVTGDANNLTVSSTGDAALSAISTGTTQGINDIAQSAHALVDNNFVSSETNEFKDVIEDVTFNALVVNTGSPSTLTISQDKDNASELINEFIAGYNNLADEISGLGAPKQGRLAFDANLRSVKQQMSNNLLNSVTGLTGSIQSLSDMGIELNRNGKLEISTFSSETILSGQNRLNNALENKLTEVGQIFASNNGVATQISSMIDTYIDSDGVLTQRQSSLNERISSVKDEWDTLEERLRSFEDTLRKQFTALDATVAQYNATSDWIGTTLSAMLPTKK